MNNESKKVLLNIIHGRFFLTNEEKQITFHYVFDNANGTKTKLEYALFKNDTKQIEKLLLLLTLKEKSFVLNDMKIVHYKNNIFIISAGKQKLTTAIIEPKRSEIIKFVKDNTVRKQRVNKRISVG